MNRAELYDAWRRRDVARLIWALRDADSERRSITAHYLGRLRNPEAVPALIDSLDDPSEEVRMTVLRALARIGDKRAVARVAETAENDPALEVSTRAVDVLAQLDDPRGVAGFVSLLTETDRHLADGRHRTWTAKELQGSRFIATSHRKVKWRVQRWAARRLVELRARDVAPAVAAAAPRAGSFRERVLLRRTAWRLRHPPRGRGRLRGYLWWWVVLLVVFVLAAKISGNGSTAWAVVQYFSLTVLGLVLLVGLVGGLLGLKDRRRG